MNRDVRTIVELFVFVFAFASLPIRADVLELKPGLWISSVCAMDDVRNLEIDRQPIRDSSEALRYSLRYFRPSSTGQKLTGIFVMVAATAPHSFAKDVVLKLFDHRTGQEIAPTFVSRQTSGFQGLDGSFRSIHNCGVVVSNRYQGVSIDVNFGIADDQFQPIASLDIKDKQDLPDGLFRKLRTIREEDSSEAEGFVDMVRVVTSKPVGLDDWQFRLMCTDKAGNTFISDGCSPVPLSREEWIMGPETRDARRVGLTDQTISQIRLEGRPFHWQRFGSMKRGKRVDH